MTDRRSTGATSVNDARPAKNKGLTVLAYGMAKMVPAALMFLAVGMLLRAFGAQEYGVYSQVWVVASAASGLSVGWLRQAELRYTGSVTNSIRNVRPAAVAGSIAASAVLTVLGSLALLGLNEAKPLLAAAFVLAASLSYYSLRLSRAQRAVNLRAYNIGEIGRAVCGILLALGLASVLKPAAWQIVLGMGVGYLAAVWMLPSLRREPNSEDHATRTFFQFGWPLGIWLGLATGMLYVDRILLAGHVTAFALGNYAAASDVLVRGMTLVGAPFILYAHPQVMKLANTGKISQSLQLIKIWTIVGFGLCVGLGAIAWIFAGPLSRMLGISGVPNQVVGFLVTGGALWQLAQIAHKPLEIHGRTVRMLGAICAAFSAQVLIMSLSIPRFGLSGAALGMVVGPILYLTYCVLASRRVVGMNT